MTHTENYSDRLSGSLALGATIVLWAGAFPAITIALGDIEPIPLAAARFVIASVPMLAVLLWNLPRSTNGRDLALAVAGGLVGIAGYNALLNTGQTLVSASVAGFIIGIQPLFAALLAGLFLRERVSRQQWLGIAISITGLIVILMARREVDGSAIGIALVTFAAVCSGGSFVIQRPAIGRLGLFVCMPIVVLSGTLALAPWIEEGVSSAFRASDLAKLALVYLALGAGFTGYLTWAHALHVFGAARASSFLFLMAPVAATMDAFITGAIPPLGVLIGGAVATTGVAVGTIRMRRNV